jgi:hypothetical protein
VVSAFLSCSFVFIKGTAFICFLANSTGEVHFLKNLPSQAPWLTPVIPPTQEAEIRRIVLQSQTGQIVCETLSQINSTQNWAGRVAQGVESLPSRCEALSSNPSTAPATQRQEGGQFKTTPKAKLAGQYLKNN